MSIREQYNIPQDSKILLYVGNISENKNQRQMVEAFDLLPQELQQNTYVLFCGGLRPEDRLKELISSQSYFSHLIICGAVEKSDMPSYYMAADAVVLLSHSEGFGLSLIEGMHFGLPCAMFSDLDAFDDIFDECAVVAIKSRDNSSVSNGIKRLLTSRWNKKSIADYSHKFESSAMAQSYVELYKSVAENQAK